MQRKFLTNLLLLMSLNLLVKPAYIFGIDLRVQNLVGPDEYGVFFAVFNFSMLFNMLLDFGITNFNNRNISRHKHLLNKHFSGIVTLRLLMGVFYAVVTIGLGLIAGYDLRQMGLLGVLVFNQFLLAFIMYLRSNISGLQLFKTDSIISVLDRMIMILLCGVMIYSHRYSAQFRVEHFAFLQTVSYLIVSFIALQIVIRKAAFRRFYWNPLFARMIIRKSFPFAVLMLLMMFYFRIDSVLLERLLPSGTGARQAGIYASAFRLLDALIMVPYLFSVLLLPMFSRMLRNKEDIRQIISLAFPMLLVFSITITALSLGFSEEIMSVLYKGHPSESAAVFRNLIPGLIAFSVSYIFSTLLTANGSLKALNLIAGGSMVLNITLNLILIPKYQAVGSAFASCTTLILAAAMQLFVSVRLFGLVPGRGLIIRFLTFLAAIGLVLFFQQYLPVTWPVRVLLSGLLILVFSIVSGLIKPMHLVSIIRNQTLVSSGEEK